MNVSEMVSYLKNVGLYVTNVPNHPYSLHVESSREMPDFIWELPGWIVSTCGIGRVFLTKVS